MYPMVVLVVDDEELVLEVVAKMFQRAGHEVLKARSINEARRIWWRPTQHLDLVVTDVQLQGSSGFLLATELSLSWPHMPVLFISGGYREGDPCVQLHLEPGRAFLEKPFNERTLMAKVVDLVKAASKAPAVRYAYGAA